MTVILPQSVVTSAFLVRAVDPDPDTPSELVEVLDAFDACGWQVLAILPVDSETVRAVARRISGSSSTIAELEHALPCCLASRSAQPEGVVS